MQAPLDWTGNATSNRDIGLSRVCLDCSWTGSLHRVRCFFRQDYDRKGSSEHFYIDPNGCSAVHDHNNNYSE